jgi:two-component system NtrC family sensor kinase
MGTSAERTSTDRIPLLTIRAALFLAFALLVLGGGGISIFLGYQVTSDAVVDEAQRRVTQDLRSAWSVLGREQERVQSIVKFAALIQKTHDVLAGSARDPEWVRMRMETIRKEYGLDILTLVGPDSRVILRTRYPYRNGDPVHLDPVIQKAIRTHTAVGIVITPASILEAEGQGLSEQAFMEVKDTPMAAPSIKNVETDGMMVKACEAVLDESGRVIGYVYGGVLLNRNFAIPDAIRDTTFRNETFDGKPVGTATLFQGDLRIATNVQNANGTRAIGTRVSRAVREITLENGLPYNDRAFVVNDWYISSYEPIRDPDDRVIGILYVGVLEKKYLSYRTLLIQSFMGMTLLGTLLALALGITLAFWIARPIRRLTQTARKVSQGDFMARVEDKPYGVREIVTLNQMFNEMADSIVREGNALVRTNTALQGANQELKRLNANYMDMLEFVTHELKSPLASVLFGINSLKEGYIGDLRPDQRAIVESAERNVEYLNEMISNYLNLSRIEKDELQFKPQPVEFRREVIEPALAQVAGQFAAHDMIIECRMPGDVAVQGDPDLLRIVMDNLLSNATKYGRKGSTVTIEWEPAPDDRHCFKVRNQGRGIPEQDITRLFQKFSRLDTEELRAKRGTGLGLFITRQIVERHGGRIWATSVENEWACFHFELPAAHVEA